MATRLLVFVLALFYLALGICGFFPSLVLPPHNRPDFFFGGVTAGYGMLFGFLPINITHNILYILLGGSGLLSAPSFAMATAWCRGMFFLMVLLVFVGVLPPPLSHVFGLIPLFDFNCFIHLVTGVLAWYFGLIYPIAQGLATPDVESVFRAWQSD